MKKITIITVCYNDVLALKRTIESVQSQSFDLQHVVVDGDSSDGTIELLTKSALEYSNLRFISEPDNGVYDAINKGIKIANSEYLLVLNAGDTFHSSASLELIFSSKFYYGQAYLVGRVDYLYSSGRIKNDNQHFFSLDNLECSHQAFIYKRSLHEKLGYYSLSYSSASDYDFFSRVYDEFGLLQKEKIPVTIAIREKFGGDMSDSVTHTIEMLKIDFEYDKLKFTFARRCKELVVKLVKLIKAG